MEKIPKIKFVSFEKFAIKTEQKENPSKMPFLSYFLPGHNDVSNNSINKIVKEELSRLFKESSINKELFKVKQMRQFLKNSWQRDSFLYFNGTYFPHRWVDTKGQARPERESFVLLMYGKKIKKEGIESIYKRSLVDNQETVLAMGEGGLYFPDHDNKTLFISRGIVCQGNSFSEEKIDNKITEMHKKIFGEEIKVITLTQPSETTHLDTHFSIIPKTQNTLIENKYYDKLEKLGELEKIKEMGYKPIQIPNTSVNCPLNILYLENSFGDLCAFLNPRSHPFIKDILINNKIKVYTVSEFLSNFIDNKQGGIRCLTNELYSKDIKFLNKLGFQK